ncbi:MAG: cobalamin-binding protein [Pseudomonadota bacterium]|nr:cobalamin-binding protein [Pseudomonadota bacterium]
MLNFPPQRLVCLSEETVETIYLLEEEEKIVGVTGYAVRPSRVRSEKTRVSSFVSANTDKIKGLKPDLILTFSDVQADLSRELILEGFNVIAFNQRSIVEIFAMIETLGALLKCPAKAVRLISTLKKTIAETKKAIKSPKPRVYFEEWDEPLITGVSWVSEIVAFAGGVDVFSSKSNCSKAEGRVVSEQEVIDANPDIIITSWCGKKVNFDMIKKRKGWNKINAIVNQHVFEVKSPIILQPGPAAILNGLPAVSNVISSWHKFYEKEVFP